MPDRDSESRGKIAVLIESFFDESEFRRLSEFFPANGYDVEYVSDLQGKQQHTIHGMEMQEKLVVTMDVNDVSPPDYAGIILADGYTMDRLRYQERVGRAEPNRAPAVVFLRKAVEAMVYDEVVIGASGHGLWLFCAAPELLRGRRVTCAHNIVSDVLHAGGIVEFDGNCAAAVVVDRNLITARDSSVADEYLQLYLAQLHRIENLMARLAA